MIVATLASPPESWRPRALGELCDLRREPVEPASATTSRYVGLEHIDPGISHLRRWAGVGEVRSTKNRFYRKDILYGKLRPYLDKAVLAEWDGICSTDILILQPKRSCGDPGYISFLLHIPEFLAHAAATTSGVNHPRTSWAAIGQFSHPVPPLPEQRAIAGVLAKIQAAVEVQEKIVASLKELKAATMAKLFREGLRGEPLKQTEIGEIPESWNLVRLGDVAEIIYGVQAAVAHSVDSSVGIPILTNVNITNDGFVDLSTLRFYALSSDRRERLLLKKGDVLFNWRSGSVEHVGKTALFNLDGEYTFSSFILRFRPKSGEIDNAFLFYYFQNLKRKGFFVNQRQQSSVNSVFNASISARIPVVVPEFAEQREIASRLLQVDKKIEVESEKHAKLKSVFSSMLHLLMTGQVRVTRRMIALQALADRAARRPKWSGTVDEKLLQEVVRRIVEAVAPDKIILFGSAARGEMGPDSDLDLLVVKACDSPREVERVIYRRLIGIGVPKDVLVVTPEHLEKHKDTIGYIYRPALREGKAIYAG